MEIMTVVEAIRNRPGLYVGERGKRATLNLVGSVINVAFAVRDHCDADYTKGSFLEYQVDDDCLRLHLVWGDPIRCWANSLDEMLDPTRLQSNRQIGLAIASALSDQLQFIVRRGDQCFRLATENGEIVTRERTERNGVGRSSVNVNLAPDRTRVGEFDLSDEFLIGYIDGAAGQHDCWDTRKGVST